MHGKSFPILPKSSSIKASVHCYCARRKQKTEVHKKDVMTSACKAGLFVPVCQSTTRTDSTNGQSVAHSLTVSMHLASAE